MFLIIFQSFCVRNRNRINIRFSFKQFSFLHLSVMKCFFIVEFDLVIFFSNQEKHRFRFNVNFVLYVWGGKEKKSERNKKKIFDFIDVLLVYFLFCLTTLKLYIFIFLISDANGTNGRHQEERKSSQQLSEFSNIYKNFFIRTYIKIGQ